MDLRLDHLIDEGALVHVEARPAPPPVGASPDLSTPDGLAQARRSLSPRPPDPRASSRMVRAGGREVMVRVILPAVGDPVAVYLDIHGGGFYMSSASRSDSANVALADALRIAVVSVDYRLAPEHPWPAAPDDCDTAARWLVDRAGAEIGTTRLLIGGASAGANLALATLLRLRDRSQVDAFEAAVLRYGAYDLSGLTPGGLLYADEWFIGAYAGHVTDRSVPDLSPLFGDLRGLPPALLVVGEDDLLLEDSLALAGRLSAAGNDVELHVYPHAAHGFTSSATAVGRYAVSRITAWLGERLHQA